MQRRILPFIIVILLYIIAIVHMLAFVYYWYWTYFWLDMVMHFLGGLWLSLFSLWFYFFSPRRKEDVSVNTRDVWAIAIVVTLIIGLLWEIFEFSVDSLISLREYDPRDAASDMVCDLLGASVGSFYFLRIMKPHEQKP
ncbi:hypothetical protein L0Y49_03020 [bacterium]|nr:hypothetical protein [bacterium]MCI0565873.1 hypothetical protein [bacterium]MCI0680148.1 hypothetical protein [bacterium]